MLSNQRGHAGYWLREPNVTAVNTNIYYTPSVFNFLVVQVSQTSRFGQRVVATLHEYDITALGLHQQHMGFPAGWDQEIMGWRCKVETQKELLQ